MIGKKNIKTKKGTTLIEALAFLFIFSVITVTFYSAWSLGTRYILLSKNRLVGIALANEKMEVVRNLSFEDIAHTSGSPAGNLHQDEDIVRSGHTYHIFTQILNRDDPFDGTVSDIDPDFIDYKEVKITVSWGEAEPNQQVSLLSRFVPAGIEQPADGFGVLVVNVTSDKDGGALISGSTVRVQNTDIGFDETHTTDSMGRLLLVGIPESDGGYMITLSKSGYETVSTLSPYPTSPYNPVHEHASVVELRVNPVDMYQNKLSDLSIGTKNYLGDNMPGISFHLSGGRVLGTNDTDPNIKYYNEDMHETTDGDGEKVYEDISPGPYTFTIEEDGYEIIGMNQTSPFSINPDESKTLTVKVSPDTATAVLFKVEKSLGGDSIPSASVHLSSPAPYSVTKTADEAGYVFFPTDATPFVAGNYDFTVSASGYNEETGHVTISNGALSIETVSMTEL